MGRHTKKYLKKLKEKPLRKKFINAIYDEIAKDPYAFDSKTGDLLGYYTYSFTYKGIHYRIAYRIDDEKVLIVVPLAGSHENFYKLLKRIISSEK